ncbi:MAG: (2Fe-2S)-binding protein [Chloroflexi bacterium]|nr:(2Fe-2S)-binding protein [Chloroflexota bacterium]
MRVERHPILGPLPEAETVEIDVDGRPFVARAGEPLAVALLNGGIRALRFTRKYGEPRGIFCALGRCTDCVMTVDGIPNVRTCVLPVRAGMHVETQHGLGEWRHHAGEDRT